MAEQLKLVLRQDLGSDVSTFDLQTLVGDSGWRQQIASSEDEAAFIDEAMTLHIPGSSDDNLAATLQSLDQYLRDARRYYTNPIEKYGVWLRAQLAGESGARQALIVDSKRGEADVVGWYIDRHILNDYPLGLKRTPFWEDTSPITRTIATLDSVGGYEQLLGGAGDAVLGDVPARTALITLLPSLSPTTVKRFWIGFRTDRFGIVENFVTRWEAESGTLGTDTSITTANDATASGTGTGRSIRCTFATPTLAQRWVMELEVAAPTHPVDQAGDFLVLGRFKCTNSNTQARVRLRSGFFDSDQWRTSPRVLITNDVFNNWQLYELGQVTIPSTGRGWESLNVINHQALAIDAERIAGNGSLDFDCVVLIPISEGYIYVDAGSHFGPVRGGAPTVYVRRMADLRLTAAAIAGGGTSFFSDVYVSQFGGVPSGSKVYVATAATRDGSSTLTDQYGLEIQSYNRWLTLRGAE